MKLICFSVILVFCDSCCSQQAKSETNPVYVTNPSEEDFGWKGAVYDALQDCADQDAKKYPPTSPHRVL